MSDPIEAHLLAGLPMLAERAAAAVADDPAEDEPTRRQARVAQVRALVALGRPAAAARVAETLPGDGEGERVARALARWATGDPGGARAILHPALERDPGLLALWVGAEITRAAGDVAGAVGLAGRAHELARADPRWSPHTELTLGRCVADAGDLTLGAALVARAVAAFRRHAPGTVALAEALDAAGACSRKRGDPGAAVGMHREALALWEGALGAHAGPVAGSRYALAHALHRANEFPAALVEMRRAHALTERAWGADHTDTWITSFELGRLEVDNGEMLDGFPRMERARAEVARRLGAQHPVVRAMDRYL